MTISELIAALSKIQAQYGPGVPVAVLDADTGWKLPLDAIRLSADGWLLIEGVGYYIDNAEMIRPEYPIVTLWENDD